MKRLLAIFSLLIFTFSCENAEKSLPEGVSFIIANYNNLTVGTNWYYYTLELDTETKEGSFSLSLNDGNMTIYEIDIFLTDENVQEINQKINSVRFKDCTNVEKIIGLESKSISFYDHEVEAVLLNNNMQTRELESDENFMYIINTDDSCYAEEHSYYFTSSYSGFYELFKEIIEAQDDVGSLPTDWKDYI